MASGNAAQKYIWDMQRFGFWPSKILNRFTQPNLPKIMCVSIPKSGTHLLERALCLHPSLSRKFLPTIHDNNIGRFGGLAHVCSTVRPGQILVSHFVYRPATSETLQNSGIRSLFMIRDPRDIVVSQVFYILKNKKHHYHDVYKSQPDFESCLKLAIQGDPSREVGSLSERLRQYLGWLESGTYTVRFEDLIGSEGGGDKSQQVETLRTVYRVVGLDLDESTLMMLQDKLFGDMSPTFRKGAIGQWQQHFSDEILTIYRNAEIAELTSRYGYSVD
jgi:hypothetical protein